MTTYRPTAALLRAISRASSGASFSSSASPSAAAAAFPAKQVTRRNFEAALSELRRHVRSADFVAIDLEMTGVTSAPWRECFEFDGSDVRYLKVKDSAEKFAVVQVGVVPFRWDSNSLSFVAYPHNFYVFPRQELTTVDRASYEFLCQTRSIDFLAKYKFDFNACIREGISYLSRRQESEAIERLNSSYEEESHNLKEESTSDAPLLSIVDTLFAERMKKRFSEWHDWLLTPQSREIQFQGNLNDSKHQFNTQFFKMRPAISLNGFTSTQLGSFNRVGHFRMLRPYEAEHERLTYLNYLFDRVGHFRMLRPYEAQHGKCNCNRVKTIGACERYFSRRTMIS